MIIIKAFIMGHSNPKHSGQGHSEPSVKVPGIHPYPLHPGVQLLARILVPPDFAGGTIFSG